MDSTTNPYEVFCTSIFLDHEKIKIAQVQSGTQYSYFESGSYLAEVLQAENLKMIFYCGEFDKIDEQPLYKGFRSRLDPQIPIIAINHVAPSHFDIQIKFGMNQPPQSGVIITIGFYY